ncbi:MAG: DUF192 domain-containing protein [Leptospiraceae bacterium]|nr:DUF192 domain-containing protein [Leptospiraceae bacterium]MCP5497703.1 DUF192 domain-containing protein [Leptospiraceae bacterium]
MFYKKLILLVGLYFILSVYFASFSEEKIINEVVTILVDDKPLQVEIANTPSKRQRGLMYRKSLKQNEGMLFIFPEADYLSFWMKNTYIPLSIAFFNQDRRLINIHEMKANQTKELYYSNELAIYALEVNQGWFSTNNIKEYSVLKLPKSIKVE